MYLLDTLWTAGPLVFPAVGIAPAGADGLVLKSGSDTAPAEGGLRGVLCMREVRCIHLPGWRGSGLRSRRVCYPTPLHQHCTGIR